MSSLAISAALEARLLTLGWGADRTAFENRAFEPRNDQAYQRVAFLLARPDNRENNAAFVQRGLMQVTLCFPANAGAGPALQRAEQLRAAFPRGTSLEADGGLQVIVDETAEIGPAQIEADRYLVPLRVRFYAHVWP